ncbi:MAG TPA: Crp/Fnr family transcriptional regulator [Candidatus Binataceae bacterium]|nr:Crp/Fnr family transcriptional regulator [Candidatus Binataceae bacterium]
MRATRSKAPSDLELLKRLKDLSWLSAAQLKELNAAMLVRNVKRDGVIYQELGARSAEKHILLSGTAQLNRLNGDGPRVVAMIMPGLIFRLPQMPPEVGHNFEWVALSDSRVGRLPIERYVAITLGVDYDAYARVSEPTESHLGRILARYPSFIGFALLQRVAVALMELSVEFGVQNQHGVVLGIAPTHKQIADLVGASRPKVSVVMNYLRRSKVLERDGRRLTIATKRLEAIIAGASD